LNHDEIRAVIRARVAQRLNRAAAEIGLLTPWSELGLDSLEAANLSGEIEKALGRRIDPAALWDHRTVWDLSLHLAELIGVEVTLPEDPDELNAVLRELEGAGDER
jgi:acyl carrier protein